MAETMAYSLMSGMPIKRAFDNLCAGGRIAVVGYKHMKADLKADLAPALERGLTINMVSSCAGNYLSAVNMLVSKAVKVDSLVSSRVPFEKADEAIREVSESVMKNIAVIVETTKL
jgi:threonine dehydrogenase-like Zn-dependent dehydrogenase